MTETSSPLQGETKATVTPSSYKIMPFDNLFIRVVTPDPQWSELFNPMSGGGAITEESANLIGYPVDDNGNIEIPFVGKLNVSGQTIQQVKVKLDSTFKYYLKDASITVRLVNNYISVVGEVNVPGRYHLTKDRVNIFEAISLAGDLTPYSERSKIQIIRPSPYGPIIKELSLLDRDIMKSDFYYIMPNDVIYAQPVKGRTFQMNSTVYSLILSSITTFLTILVFVRASGE